MKGRKKKKERKERKEERKIEKSKLREAWDMTLVTWTGILST